MCQLGFSSLLETVTYFKDEPTCLAYLLRQRFSNGLFCPRCQHTRIYSYSDGVRYKCGKCRREFTAKVGTIFEGSKLPLQKWYCAMYLIATHKKGISSHQLARDLSITQKSAWFLLHRIRAGMNTQPVEQLQGSVQLDETFIGGKNKNRHASKKVPQSQGRSFKDKAPVMGLLQSQVAHTIERPHKLHPIKTVKEKVVIIPAVVRCKVVPDTKGRSLRPIVRNNVKPGSLVVSDEWHAYRGLNNAYDHRIIDHRAKQYVNQAGDTTNAIEGFWSGVKRSYIGIYHYMSKRHLQAYMNELEFRYNNRHLSQQEIINLLFAQANKRLTYKTLINKN